MYQLYLVLVLASVSALHAAYNDTHSPEAVKLFEAWQEKNGRTYKTEIEKWYRYRVFLDSIRTINALNGKPRKDSDAAIFGLTPFADLTAAEFQKDILQSFKPLKHSAHKMHKSNYTVKAPAAFDWTTQEGVVTSVKDQGGAGTCWAFAGCANVESLWNLRSGETVDLSTEALNDCDGIADVAKQALACGPLGATMPGFYEFVIEEGGLMRWSDYPYCVGTAECSPCAPEGFSELYCQNPWPINPCKAEDSCAAKYDPSKFVPGLKVTAYETFSSNENSLLDDLVQVGPLVAGIDATDLQHYEGGVLEPILCDPAALNHAVLLVGYGETSEGSIYWRFKNSWGTQWGEEGFGRIIRGVDACGVNTDVTSAVLG